MLSVLVSDVLSIRGDVVDENLRHAFPQYSQEKRREVARRMWEHLFLMGIEVVQAPRKIHDTNWRDFVTLVGADQIIRACFDDRPTVMICGHYGNFELSGYVLALLGFPSFTVARPLDNPYLDRFINDFRERTGQFILSKKGSSHEIQHVLDQGGLLALLGDQHAGRKGCYVDFFGRPASSHKAIALFSLGSERAGPVLLHAPNLGNPAARNGRERRAGSAHDGRRYAHRAGRHPVVHQAAGRYHSSSARAVLVAAPPLARRSPAQGPAARGRLKRSAALLFPKRTNMPQWTRIARLEECPPGAGIERVAGERVIALFNVAGTISAIDGVCPHQGGPLGQGEMTGTVVTCPWHGWQFDVRTGQHQLNPRMAQQVFNVRVEDGWILVDLG